MLFYLPEISYFGFWDHQKRPLRLSKMHFGVVRRNPGEKYLWFQSYFSRWEHNYMPRTNIGVSIGCCCHKQNNQTGNHEKDCLLGSSLTVQVWISGSERSRSHHDHGCSKLDHLIRNNVVGDRICMGDSKSDCVNEVCIRILEKHPTTFFKASLVLTRSKPSEQNIYVQVMHSTNCPLLRQSQI